MKLVCHPYTPGAAVQEIAVSVVLIESARLELHYRLQGDVDALRVPEPGPVRRVDRLWERTCFEVFIAVEGEPAYVEFNFSPSREWAAYAFRAYREPQTFEPSVSPHVKTLRGPGFIELRAVVNLASVPLGLLNRPLRLGLSAVIEALDGERSYWALVHPGEKPDFHHPEAFALKLEPVNRAGHA